LNPDAILKLLNEQPVSEMKEVEKLEKKMHSLLSKYLEARMGRWLDGSQREWEKTSHQYRY